MVSEKWIHRKNCADVLWNHPLSLCAGRQTQEDNVTGWKSNDSSGTASWMTAWTSEVCFSSSREEVGEEADLIRKREATIRRYTTRITFFFLLLPPDVLCYNNTCRWEEEKIYWGKLRSIQSSCGHMNHLFFLLLLTPIQKVYFVHLHSSLVTRYTEIPQVTSESAGFVLFFISQLWREMMVRTYGRGRKKVMLQSSLTVEHEVQVAEAWIERTITTRLDWEAVWTTHTQKGKRVDVRSRRWSVPHATNRLVQYSTTVHTVRETHIEEKERQAADERMTACRPDCPDV